MEEKVSNFRDLGGFEVDLKDIQWMDDNFGSGCRKFQVKRNMLFRSAAVTSLSEKEIVRLGDDHGIRSIIDLRKEDEVQEHLKDGKVEDLPVFKVFKKKGLPSSPRNADRSFEFVPLITKFNAAKYCVLRASYEDIFKSAGHMLWMDTKKAKLAITNCLWKDGLVGINNLIFESAKKMIFKTLSLITRNVENNIPTLFNCAWGKDRTGLIAFFLLFSLRVGVDDIKDDYHMSETLLTFDQMKECIPKAFMQNIEDGVENSKLQTNDLFLAPKIVIDKVMQILDERYGGVFAYLDSIGFDAEHRLRLQKAMIEPIL